MGSKLKETNELIDFLSRELDRSFTEEKLVKTQKAAHTTFLGDIAKSLAIIADHM